ncbi:hypothetical protein AAE478_009833 [Parahypoxylon ruwenzoriense]
MMFLVYMVLGYLLVMAAMRSSTMPTLNDICEAFRTATPTVMRGLAIGTGYLIVAVMWIFLLVLHYADRYWGPQSALSVAAAQAAAILPATAGIRQILMAVVRGADAVADVDVNADAHSGGEGPDDGAGGDGAEGDDSETAIQDEEQGGAANNDDNNDDAEEEGYYDENGNYMDKYTYYDEKGTHIDGYDYYS